MAWMVINHAVTTEALVFLPGLDHVGFSVDKEALGQVFLQVFWFTPELCYLCSILMHSPITSAI
jgi:hypothetical protein